MKANDLRIGNWVKHNSEWCYRGEDVYDFQWNESDWYALGECTLFLENIEPIPLTEEWFLRFEFEKDDFCSAYIRYTLNGLVIIHDLKNNIFLVDNFKNNLVYLKYVHQLQNLYFALTDKELEIKEQLKNRT
jgi:hypothetical protein